MKHKTSDLEGALLDAAVAKAEGWDGIVGVAGRPSTSWAAGGPIIERERINVYCGGSAERGWIWSALVFWGDDDDPIEIEIVGSTPLIAAMRVYVASKLGEEVEL